MEPINLEFTHDRETKGTHVFKEVQEDPTSRPVVGTLYVLKAVMSSAPARIHVTIQS